MPTYDDPLLGCRFLRHARYGLAGQVVLAAVGIDHEHDEDLALVHDPGDPRVGAVAVGQPAKDRQGLLYREVLAGVVEAVEQDLGLGLVGGDVVGDLDRPDLAALVTLADRELADDARVIGDGRVDLLDHLRVVVIAGVLGREVGGRRGPGGDGAGGDREQQGEEAEACGAAGRVGVRAGVRRGSGCA